MDQKLALLESVTFLSALATEATVVFDDVTDKIEDMPELQNRLRISDEELKLCEKTLRKIMDRNFDLRGALREEVLSALSNENLPGPYTGVNQAATSQDASQDDMLEAAQLSNTGPGPKKQFESCLLPAGSVDQLPEAASGKA